MLIHKPTTCTHLKVFGCLGYASTLPKTIHKFSPRALPAVFLGYPNGFKCYKMIDIATNTTFISTDVIFQETAFPFKDQLFNLRSQLSADFFDEFVLPTQLSSQPNDASEGSLSSTPVLSQKRKVPSSSYLQDFHCYSMYNNPVSINSCKSSHPLSSVLSYDKLSPSHRKFVCSISSHIEPDTYTQVVTDPN